MTTKPKKPSPKVQNPHYAGATPEMVGRALVRHTGPAPQTEDADQAEPEA